MDRVSPPILVFGVLDSTNSEAARRAEAGEPGPVWLLARRQTAGRGRRGRAWSAQPGNLTATLLLTLDKPPQEAAQLAFVAALAVGELAQAYVPAGLVKLKWPNDVLIDGRKAAGVLIEAGAARGGGQWLAVGVGVNLSGYPRDVERPATAIADHLRHEIAAPPSQDEAMDRLAAAFARMFDLWTATGFEAIRQAWTAQAAGLGGPCVARMPSGSIDGVAEGLDEAGALLLRLKDGSVRRITAGDILVGSP